MHPKKTQFCAQVTFLHNSLVKENIVYRCIGGIYFCGAPGDQELVLLPREGQLPGGRVDAELRRSRAARVNLLLIEKPRPDPLRYFCGKAGCC